MTFLRDRMIAVFAGLLMTVLFTDASRAQTSAPNPLSVSPMPRCGPLDDAFERLLKDLKLRSTWRGSHENQSGELELAVGRGGSWFLFYHARDRYDRIRVCLIARGHHSKAIFGNPV